MKEYSDIIEYADDKNRHIMKVVSKTEQIKIIIYKIKFDHTLTLTENSSLERKGTEPHLQEWLAQKENFKAVFGTHCYCIRREFDTGNGSCDLIGINNETNKIMLIEVKRSASKKDIYQVVRYRDAINQLYEQSIKHNSTTLENRQMDTQIQIEQAEPPVELFLVASEVKRGVKEEGEKHKVDIIELGYDWID